jgi:hypothetical protein
MVVAVNRVVRRLHVTHPETRRAKSRALKSLLALVLHVQRLADHLRLFSVPEAGDAEAMVEFLLCVGTRSRIYRARVDENGDPRSLKPGFRPRSLNQP